MPRVTGIGRLLTCLVALLMVIGSVVLPDAASAYPVHADDGAAHAVPDTSATERAVPGHDHCDPGVDCQSIAIIGIVPGLPHAQAEFFNRTISAPQNVKGREIGFDLPPPRHLLSFPR